MSQGRLSGLLVVGTLLLTPSTTLAQKRLAVLEFSGDRDVVSDAELAYLADKTRGAALKALNPVEWEIMTRENMLVMIETNAEDLAACLGECEVETGRLIGAHQVVAGSLLKLGANLRLTLKSFDTDSGRMLGYEEVSAKDIEEIANGISSACGVMLNGRQPGSSTVAVESEGSEEGVGELDATRPPPVGTTAGSTPGKVIDALGYEMVPVESRGYLIGATEVTQELWETVMGTSPSSFKGARRPVDRMSWYDAIAFCNELSVLEALSPAYQVDGTGVTWDQAANGYRLPTEAEWILAARAEEDYKYSGSNKLNDIGWHTGNSGFKTHPVAEKQANAWGLYDMTGNVWEWVWDLWEPGSSRRVVRGGAWDSGHVLARLTYRWWRDPVPQTNSGLRLARSSP